MAYVNKRSGKNGAERFTGLYKAADGTYKSAGTFETEARALEVAEGAERHARLLLAVLVKRYAPLKTDVREGPVVVIP